MTDEECRPAAVHVAKEHVMPVAGKEHWRWLKVSPYGPYQSSIPLTFGFNVDFGQLIKSFGSSQDEHRYSPAGLAGVKTTIGCGTPVDICTSHVERNNLTMRMQMRRLTRLTNAHSKSLDHHKAMLALYFAWYNSCRIHSTPGTTPAVAHGLEDRPWTIEELLEKAAIAAGNV